MEEDIWMSILRNHHVRPTANRIIILRALDAADRALTLREVEDRVLSIDKSGVFRALTLFRQNHLVHDIEDGDGVVRYELCMGSGGKNDDDLHVHFFCEHCHQTFCLYDCPVPEITLPEGYVGSGVNYVVKGLCPACARKKGRPADQL